MARVILLMSSWSAKALHPLAAHTAAAIARHHSAPMNSSGGGDGVGGVGVVPAQGGRRLLVACLAGELQQAATAIRVAIIGGGISHAPAIDLVGELLGVVGISRRI